MTDLLLDSAATEHSSVRVSGLSASRAALAAAVLGFFIVTFDAVVLNVSLPSIRSDLGGGITGLQWVVDGYTLMFAALLLAAGAFSDRTGARRVFIVGVVGFVAASAACGLAPGLGALVAARFVQGSAAAVLVPASMALISQAYPNPAQRARAIAIWAMGGAVASSSAPVLGGLLTVASWRLIFLINIPIGLLAVGLATQAAPSRRVDVRFDRFGFVTAFLAMGGLTFGAIEAGERGFTSPFSLAAFVVAAASFAVFVVWQRHAPHPLVPLELFRRRNVSVAVVVGFAFVVGYYGLPFVMSLYLQQMYGLSAFQTGLVFVPMMVIGGVLTPYSARIAERFGARRVVATGLVLMAAGLALLAIVTSTAAPWTVAALMLPVGLAGPLIMPPITSVLLNSVPDAVAGTASGVFNTSRQLGGALAVAVFGALVAQPAGFVHGLRVSLGLAAVVALAAAAASRLITTPTSNHNPTRSRLLQRHHPRTDTGSELLVVPGARHIDFYDLHRRHPLRPPRRVLPQLHRRDKRQRSARRSLSMKFTRSGGATIVGPEAWLTGTVYIDGIRKPDEQSCVGCAHVRFTSGARTAWDTHPRGQTLYVTDGIGFAGRRGGEVHEIRPGDVVYIEPNEDHRHGTTPDRFMAHVAIQEADENGQVVTWGDHVTNAEYNVDEHEHDL